MSIDVRDYRIDFHILEPLERTEPDHYVTEISGKLVCAPDGMDPNGTIVGEIEASWIRVGLAADAGEDLFEIFDSEQELCNVWSAVYDEQTEGWRESVSEMSFGDLLYVARITIIPAHRSKRLGLKLLTAVVEAFGSDCSAAVILPHPIKGAEGFTGRGTQKAKTEAKVKLQRYWQRLGFRRIPGTDYFAVDMRGRGLKALGGLRRGRAA